MTRTLLLSRLAAALCAGALAARGALAGGVPADCPAEDTSPVIEVEVETSLGTITLGLLPEVAPATVANFQSYQNALLFEDGFVHRAVPNFVVQLGGYRHDGASFQPIDRPFGAANEPCMSNVRGTIAMAKSDGLPDSATSEWFINLGDNSANLDNQNGGFTVFGTVLSGMDVADQISQIWIEDLRFSSNDPLRSVFSDLPLTAMPAFLPSGYDCFPLLAPLTSVGVLFNLALTNFEPDPVTHGYYFVSRNCAPPPNDPTCTVDRTGGVYNLATNSVVMNPGGGIPSFPISCEVLRASDAGIASRRDHVEPLIPPLLVEASVPEPGGMLLLLTGAAVLGACRGRRAQSSS